MPSFEFAFERKYRAPLALIGVTPGTSGVDVDDEQVRVRFGPWRCTIERTNIRDVQISGPYLAAKAIGTRISLSDKGLTFGTTTAGGVCLLLHAPVPGIDPFGAVRHPGVTLTVADREALAAALATAPAGGPGSRKGSE